MNFKRSRVRAENKNYLNSNQAELCRFLAYMGVIKYGYLVK